MKGITTLTGRELDDHGDGVRKKTTTRSSSSPYSLAGRVSHFSSTAIGIGIGFFFLLFCVLALYYSSPFSPPMASPNGPDEIGDEDAELMKVLQRAKMTRTVGKGTVPASEIVILTAINKAWTEPGSLLDLFLESFWNGNGTQELARHLVIVTLDQEAHEYCESVHPHCYALKTPGVNFTGNAASYMTHEYLLIVWRRFGFYGSLLNSGLDFVFTDVDIAWLRNPFPHFDERVDFQVGCDFFFGNDSDMLNNSINTGFAFVRSNVRTRRFYEYWYDSRGRFPGTHEQEVLNNIKFEPFIRHEIGLRVKLLDTARFGGICQPIRDLDVGCTMHATCCVGRKTKIRALTAILQDWKHFSSSPPESRNSTAFAWKPQRTGCWA